MIVRCLRGPEHNTCFFPRCSVYYHSYRAYFALTLLSRFTYQFYQYHRDIDAVIGVVTIDQILFVQL
jgi:hypothetical protein